VDETPAYTLEMAVRDYECDLQGIVNNAVYQNYFEHARHEYLHSLGFDFHELHERGTDPVVTRIEIDYRYPLRSRDRFVVGLRARRQGRLRFIFEQQIHRHPDARLVAEARVTAAFVAGGRPVPPPPDLVQALEGV
jgi:acyl-CoA thioester hydrolase